MRLLNGLELAGFVKERQAHQVRGLRQAYKVSPKLAIIRCNPDPVVDSYMRLKRQYGEDVLIDVDVHTIDQKDVPALITTLNNDPTVHGIIVQLPLPDRTQTAEILDMVLPAKDVDGLGKDAVLDPATPTAIIWLLAGYNIELRGKKIAVIGKGRLVGEPLARIWKNDGLDVQVIDSKTNNRDALIRESDIVVSATGVPGLLTPEILKIGAVVVDAGVATDKNGLVGDVAPSVRERNDIVITPEKGGVGPLTVCALFENVIKAARATVAPQAKKD